MNAVKGGRSVDAQSSSVSTAAPAPAKVARVIDVSYKLLEGKLEVDNPRAQVYLGDILLWRAEEALMPEFVVAFETALGGGGPTTYVEPGLGLSDDDSGDSLADTRVRSRLARIGGIRIKADMTPGEYHYALSRSMAPPPSSYPFSIIIRQPT